MSEASMHRPAAVLLLALALVLPCLALEAAPPLEGPRRVRIALALEGGGALGMAHVGVLKVLEEAGVPVDAVAGTSMGALIGGLYAVGYDASGIESIVEGMNWSELFIEDTGQGKRTIRSDIRDSRYFAEVGFDRRGFKSRGGLLGGRKILGMLDRLTLGVPANANFDELPRPYRAVATDLEKGTEIDFSSGNLADAMRASMSFPAIFAPYSVNGRYYVDGGVVNNLPVDVAKRMGADVVIAVHIVGGEPYDPEKAERSPIDAAIRSLDQLTRGNTLDKMAMADFVITVDLQGYWITDFGESAEIMAKGEAAARAKMDELRAFLDKLGKPEARPVRRAEAGPFAAVSVEGAVSDRDKAEAARIYSGVVGVADPDGVLASAYRELDKRRKYDSIRVSAEGSGEGKRLVVSLTKRPDPDSSLRLGLVYSGYLTDSISNKMILTPGVALRGFPGPDSELDVDLALLDSPGVEVDFVQPLFGPVDFRASVSAKRGYDNYYDANAANYQYQTMAASGGIFFETGGLRNELLSLGWRADLLSTDDISTIYSCPSVKHASLLLVSSEYRKLDHAVLPTSGVSIDVDYALSLPGLGSERWFQTLAGKGGLYLPLVGAFSFGVKGIAGTDFSPASGDALAAPLHYKPLLSDRSLFPAPLEIDETIGSVVAGCGIDLKFNLRRPAGLVNIPLYAIFTAAAGTAVQDEDTLRAEGPSFHGNASLGLGVRINEAFGLFLRGGFNRNTGGKIMPFIAGDFGAIPL
jgi:NTE family protein